MLSLLTMVSMALLPLIWATTIEFGGLELSPASIGLWLSTYGCINGLFQFAIFPPAVTRFGPRGVFIASVVASAVVYVLFPFENWMLRSSPDGPAWVLILLQLTALSICKMGYSELLLRFSFERMSMADP
jgi:hypothetical protein